MKSIKSMKINRNIVIFIIIIVLIVVCLLYDNNMMKMREGFYVLPPTAAAASARSGMNNTRTVSQQRVKSAQEMMQAERKINPSDETKMLATGGAALMLLKSGAVPTRTPHIEGFANPGDCLLPIPVANDTPNSDSPFGMQYAPTHYRKNGKPALFDMVEQPTDSKYPLLVLP